MQGNDIHCGGHLFIQADYVEYMMGHTISTYHDIRVKGIEYLRGIYLTSGLSMDQKHD